MRELTDSERDYLIAYWFTELNNIITIPERFKEGFIAGLEYQSTQLAALTAERDGLAQRLEIAEEVESSPGDKLQEEKQLRANQREVNAHLARERKKAEAERDALRAEVAGHREARFSTVPKKGDCEALMKALKRMVKGWRDYASGHYCQTYNPERGKGLKIAADNLEEYINDKIN